MYGPIEPFEQGLLDCGGGQRVYWEVCGNPAGQPAVVLHGGPGSACGEAWRRYFDPAVYRIVLFDQRGCGRSLPSACDPAVDLSVNTTAHLIHDIERLRERVGVERWLVLGASWGSTLGLAYAEQNPKRVSAAVLFSVVTTTRAEVERLIGGDVLAAYRDRLESPDAGVRATAAAEWCEWEQAMAGRRDPRYDDPRFRCTFARLVTHYWQHAAFLDDGVLMRDASLLAGIPGVLIHGAGDPSPLDVPRELHARWPGSRLVVVEDAGHGAVPGIETAVVEALDGFRAGSP